jgi:hypothetical protein
MDLDISWIDEYKRLENISEDCPKELMTTIKTYVLYIDHDMNIDNILVESLPIVSANTGVGEGGAISKEVLLKYIQLKKTKNEVKYSLIDILFYNVDLESTEIDSYVGCEGGEDKFRTFFRSVSVMHEIVVSPSLFIFHSLNSLFVLFKERRPEHRHTVKSILKRVDMSLLEGGDSHSNTKKVRIVLPPQEEHMKLSKTRKHTPA